MSSHRLSGSALETAGRGSVSEDTQTDWETDGQTKTSRCEWKERETQSRAVGLNQDSRQQSDPPRHTADICKAPASGCLWSKHTHRQTEDSPSSHTHHLHPYCPTQPTPSLGSIRAGWLLPSGVKPTDLKDLQKQPLPLSSKPRPSLYVSYVSLCLEGLSAVWRHTHTHLGMSLWRLSTNETLRSCQVCCLRLVLTSNDPITGRGQSKHVLAGLNTHLPPN